MNGNSLKGNRKRFFIRIILPAILAIILFILSIYAVILPSLENNIMDRKREMIRELTNSAWSILLKYEKEETDSILTRQEAQKKSISEIRCLRYGEEMKDYFWVTDMAPDMIMHPYRTDLEGKSLSEFKDPRGKKLFVEFVNVVKKDNEGYVDYMWQWKDDSTRIVPKLSFVKIFKPWKWIIGTGIYIEDVKVEINKMESRLIKTSAFITLIIALLLIFIMRQSTRIERNRLKAEKELKHSKERYRALVEASTEGSLMIFEDDIYANKFMLDMLGYEESEIKNLKIFDIVSDENLKKQISGFRDLADSFEVPRQFESKLRLKNGSLADVMMNISKITIGEKDAVIIITKNLNKSRDEESDKERSRLMNLADSLHIGVFRSVLARRSTFVEANDSSVIIFGLQNKDELYKTNIEDLFADSDERRYFVKDLIRNGFLKEKVIKILKKDKSISYIRVSLSVTTDNEKQIKYCDGIIEDVTSQQVSELANEEVTGEMLITQNLLNLPVTGFIKPPVSCFMNTTVKKAAALMSTHKCRAVLVKTTEGDCIGIVTDDDIRKRVVAAGFDPEKPVFEIMSSPVVSISENALLFEAIIKMQDCSINHLALKDEEGKIRNIISSYDFLNIQKNTSEFLIRRINNSESAEDVVAIQPLLYQIVKNLISSCANPNQVTRIISSVSDAIIEKFNDLAIEELGPPPVPFAFITLGSVGREEQTLATDQDNAIIYEDVPAEREQEVNSYFLNLGEKICNWLNKAGYSFCKGNIMAKNPQYCKPLSVWKKYFSEWVATKEPKDLLDVNIFFDFRFSYGESSIANDLKNHISRLLDQNNLFFYHLAQNTLSLKSPISFFGNIIKDSKDKHSDSFDIKKAIMPVVGFARIYALKHGIEENNTLARARKLYEKNIILKSDHDLIIQIYAYLMNIRFSHQVEQLKENRIADNYINPDKLTELDQTVLKKIFTQVNNLFTKLSLDFKGSIN
jgi:PAS domain S-box-containing protein